MNPRIERLLINKVANKGPKKLAKGTKITKAYLESVEPHNWFDIGLAVDETAQQLESLRESIEQTRKDFDQAFEAKKKKLIFLKTKQM